MPRNSRDGSYERFNEMENLAKCYFLRAKYYKENKTVDADNKNIRQIYKIDSACNVLCDPYKTIIKNTFFEKKNLYWWEGFYSKTTYYRLRNKAIQTFLLAYKLQWKYHSNF